MARTVTFSDLQTQVRNLVDDKATTSDNSWVSPTELKARINAAIGTWHDMVAKAVPERFEKEATITATAVASAAGYDLPADYYQTIGVDYLYSSNCRQSLKRLMVQERNDYSTDSNAQAAAYRVKGAKLFLYPYPESGTYYHVYVTAAPVLAADGDTLDGINGWERWIVYAVAIELLLKEETECGQLVLERDKLWAEIQAAAVDREAGTPARVVATRKRRRLGDPDFWAGR